MNYEEEVKITNGRAIIVDSWAVESPDMVPTDIYSFWIRFHIHQKYFFCRQTKLELLKHMLFLFLVAFIDGLHIEEPPQPRHCRHGVNSISEVTFTCRFHYQF